MDQLDEITRRDLLKGAGAAAIAGAAGSASADRSWYKDPIADKWQGYMTAENYRGAELHWEDERKIVSLALTEATNFSMNNVEKNRLDFPKITSSKWTAKFGDNPPFSGNGKTYTFPMRQLGNYTGSGIILFSGATMDKVRDDFINADQVHVRLDIDGRPTTITFNENPGLLQQRRDQAAAIENAKPENIVKNAVSSGKLSQQQVNTWLQQGYNIEAIAKYIKDNIKEDQLDETTPEALAKIDELTRR